MREIEGAHPRSPHDKRDEIELFIRDAYAAGCQAAQERSLFTAMEYAAREAPKLRAVIAQQPEALPNLKWTPIGEVGPVSESGRVLVTNGSYVYDMDCEAVTEYLRQKGDVTHWAPFNLPPSMNNGEGAK